MIFHTRLKGRRRDETVVGNRVEQERVRKLLSDALTVVCINSVVFVVGNVAESLPNHWPVLCCRDRVEYGTPFGAKALFYISTITCIFSRFCSF